MTGLRLLNEIMDPATREDALRSHIHLDQPADEAVSGPAAARSSTERSSKIRLDIPVPTLPYPTAACALVPNLAEVWSYINPYMLYGRHLGFKGQFERLLADRDPKALALHDDVEEVKRLAAGFMKVRAVWRFFEAERDGNSIHLFEADEREPVHSFAFRPSADAERPVSQRLHPAGERSRRDHIALFVVTAGEGVRERSEEAKAAGRFFEAHALQALAIETAEGCAEWLHRRIREDWGFPDPPDDDDAGAIHVPLSRQAVQLWLSGVPESGRSAGALETAAAGGDRRDADRGHDDGPRSERQRARLPSSGLHVLHGCRRLTCRASSIDRRRRFGHYPVPIAFIDRRCH